MYRGTELWNTDLLWKHKDKIEEMKRETYKSNIVLVDTSGNILIIENLDYKPNYEMIFEKQYFDPNSDQIKKDYRFFSKDQEKKFLYEFEKRRIGKNIQSIYMNGATITKMLRSSQFNQWEAVTGLEYVTGPPFVKITAFNRREVCSI